jgi:tetratricopeptide (TPR) repeat protein
MKKTILCFLLITGTTLVHALDVKYAPIVNAALADLKINTTLSLLKGHVAVNISSGNKELDSQFAEAIKDAYPNFESKADAVNNEDLYQMIVKVYRENDKVFIYTTVTNFENKNIVERTAGAKTVSLAVLETLQYKTAIHAKNEFEAYLDSAFAGAGDVVMSLRIFIIRGLAFIDDEKYESALAEFNAALKLKPDFAEALYYIGDVYYYQEKYDTAIEYYTRTLNINPVPIANPKYWDAYLARGICYFDKKDYDKAIADFKESEKLRPKDAFMFFMRGRAYFDKKNHTAAISDFTKSIALKAKDNESYIYRGMSRLILKKEYDKAIQDFSQGIKIAPADAFLYYLRALAYAETSKYAQESKTKSAIADCESALKIEPDDKDTRELLASLRKRPSRPSVIGIDKDGYWYGSVGVVINEDKSILKYPDTGISGSLGVSSGYWGMSMSTDLFFPFPSGGGGLLYMLTAGLPLEISLFTIKPYAGLGLDISVISAEDESNYNEISKDLSILGVGFALGVQVKIDWFFISAEYRQRIFPSYKAEYELKDSYYYFDNTTFTEELFFKRFVISVGIAF